MDRDSAPSGFAQHPTDVSAEPGPGHRAPARTQSLRLRPRLNPAVTGAMRVLETDRPGNRPAPRPGSSGLCQRAAHLWPGSSPARLSVLIKQHNSRLATLLISSAMVACYQSSGNETRPLRTVIWGLQPFRSAWRDLGNLCSCFLLGHKWQKAQGPEGQSPGRGRHQGPLCVCALRYTDPSGMRPSTRLPITPFLFAFQRRGHGWQTEPAPTLSRARLFGGNAQASQERARGSAPAQGPSGHCSEQLCSFQLRPEGQLPPSLHWHFLADLGGRPRLRDSSPREPPLIFIFHR